ncbi:RNA polymerase sigma70 factor [Porphyromonas macacae]|uniref:RNA polymerase sigma factor n=1 Tax=Porphyromonas macacae TaxID=28115 RepID=UPI00052DEE3B|nr:RNA polymerase sigma factor [Porphyromonas macacae]KGO00528.1 RNA polymerase sigma70 factor [Porphyromonas macacae]
MGDTITIPADQLTDEQLQKMLIDPQKTRQAFGIIVKLYSERIYWQIRRMVYDHEDTNDLVQQTFLKAWGAIGGFRGDAKISTWLYRIALYEALNFLNKQKKENENRLSLNDENVYLMERLEADPYFDGDTAERDFQAAINELPEKQRLVFQLRYYDELPYDQISAITGTSEGALKASYHHAVKKLERFLVPED